MVELTKSEKKILKKIKQFTSHDAVSKYMFWFIYDDAGNAISWEGGFDLGLHHQFRNQYTLHNGQVVKNW